MYFCAVGLIALLPFFYLFCQVFTVVVYEGRWRWWCLLPLPVVAAVASAAHSFVSTPTSPLPLSPSATISPINP